MTDIQEKARALQAQIFIQLYYVELWNGALEDQQMTSEGVEGGLYSDSSLALLCHTMWEALPDGKEIRRPPFFALCDIAENVFND